MRNRLFKKNGALLLTLFFAGLYLVSGIACADEINAAACRITVFPLAGLPKGLNVRSGPGTEYPVIKNIDDSDVEVDVAGSSGKWLRIRRATAVDLTVKFKGDGWVFAPLMGVSANRSVPLHVAPDKASASVSTIKADDGGNVQSCAGEWVQVQFENRKGWMEPGSHCGNPVTTCP